MAPSVIAQLVLLGAAPAFRIESPRQTPRSILVAWDTEHKVRTTKGAQWFASTPTGATHRPTVAPGAGRAGTAAAKVVGTASAGKARGCFILHLDGLREPGDYTYSVFYRTAKQKSGCPRIVIDCYVGDERKYTGLVAKDLPSADDWREVSGTFKLPGDIRLSRILLYQVGEGTAWYDDVRISKTGTDLNCVPNSGFDADRSCRAFFREAGTSKWTCTDAVVLERFHNVIFLKPATKYELKVQRLSPEGAVEAESQTLSVATKPAHDRVWEGLWFAPDRRTPTPPAIYPCIESVGGKLYYAESRGGALWLNELGSNGKVRWTKRWVKPFLVDGRSCYQGQTQTAVFGSRLYISWKRAHHGDAPHARQCVASYDLRTGAIGEPFVIEPDAAGESTWNGGIAAVNGELWVSYCRWRRHGASFKTMVTVRRLDYERRTLGPTFELDPQPTDRPYTPFLSVFNRELVVCFTDMASRPDRQPLWLVCFDGKRFHDLMTVSPTGYNQYAKGVQYGDKLLLVWKYGVPYPSRIYGRYMFHDIGIAIVDPIAKNAKITSLIDDVKYNSSPDITLHGGRLVYVYNKFEHLYGSRSDPGRLFGCFLGQVKPVRPGESL